MLQISNLLGIQAHIADKNNPHDVTAEDLNLERVQNFAVTSQRAQYENKTSGLYATAAGVGDFVNAKLSPITEALNNMNIPIFASNAEALAGSLNNKLINPSNLKYVLDSKLPNFASDAQIDSGTSTNVMVSPAGLKRYVDNNQTDLPDWASQWIVENQRNNNSVLMSPLRTHELIEKKMPKASEDLAKVGSVNHGYMTPYLVKKAIESLGPKKFNIKQIDNGRYGVFWDPVSGFGLQWGQTLAMGPNSGTLNHFITDFIGMPFNVWGSSHVYAGDGGEWNDMCEVGAFIVSKSITNDTFKVATRRFHGANVDGVVFAWCAIGFVDPYNKGFRQTDGGKDRSSAIAFSGTGITGTPFNSSGHLVGK